MRDKISDFEREAGRLQSKLERLNDDIKLAGESAVVAGLLTSGQMLLFVNPVVRAFSFARTAYRAIRSARNARIPKLDTDALGKSLIQIGVLVGTFSKFKEFASEWSLLKQEAEDISTEIRSVRDEIARWEQEFSRSGCQ